LYTRLRKEVALLLEISFLKGSDELLCLLKFEHGAVCYCKNETQQTDFPLKSIMLNFRNILKIKQTNKRLQFSFSKLFKNKNVGHTIV
jgi:hypothetical protein